MIRRLIRYTAVALVASVVACEDALVVDNPNAGNTEKVLGTPNDAEALLSTYYKRWFSGVYGSTANLEGRLNAWSLQNFSSLANNCQNTSVPFAGNAIVNTPGNPCQGEHYRLFLILGEVNRVASSILNKMDAGDLDLLTTPRNMRARSFAEFLRAISIGYVAMVYDSVAIVSAQTDPKDPGELVHYTVALDSMYAAFDRSIALALDPAATSASEQGFPLPSGWIPSSTNFSALEFVRYAKSLRARIRANVARTKAEGDAIDWNRIIIDVDSGITADHYTLTGTNAGGTSNISWRQQYQDFTTWHQMTPFIIGMADTSGSYATWLTQPLGDRGAGNTGFFMITPDLRWPQGGTRTAQQADFAIASCETAATPCKRYFRNRPAGSDQFGGNGWGWSNYDFVRFRSWNQRGDAGTARTGRALTMAIAEMNLLKAEGLIRTGQFAAAAALINITRTAPMACFANCTSATPTLYAVGGGLPAITAFDATSPVPGGEDCVPQVPSGSGLACGNMFEAMKWEKRMETAYVHYLAWYLDSRRWGDLAEGTPLWVPVPYQDWKARGLPSSTIYHTGNVIGAAEGSAMPTKGTYGW
jgi:hypothetical protein